MVSVPPVSTLDVHKPLANNDTIFNIKTVMKAGPHSSSGVHHHGPQDTVVYVASGHGTIVSEGGRKRQQLSPGDFALIPAYAQHQEVNDGAEEVVWIITRSGRTPVVKNLEGWNAK
ncbi:MAG: hypothetical protein Q9190_001038 [Brigantiaea leucoxantha]